MATPYFIPTGMRHWTKYLDGSFFLRRYAWDQSFTRKMASVWSLFIHGAVDSIIKIIFRVRSVQWREKLTIKITKKELKKRGPSCSKD